MATRLSEKKPRPQHPDESLNCPRCHSTDTKFCYYNNYSLSQPRYFCKSCRRYWTKGGTLRNVPVGGGCRRIPRSSGAPSSPLPSCRVVTHDLDPFPPLAYESPDFKQRLITGQHETCYDLPYPIAPSARDVPWGGFGFLDNNGQGADPICSHHAEGGNEDGDGVVLFGFPWQMNGAWNYGNGISGSSSSSSSSSWYNGIVNSPLI